MIRNQTDKAGGREVTDSYTEVSFKSHDADCFAWLYEPVNDSLKGPAGVPCIVMANGFGLTNKDSLGGFAERFQAAGFKVLAFEYRCLGQSGGKPRQLISNKHQLQDWDSAIVYAKTLEGIDTNRLIIWGCSYTGGHVIITASKHPELFATVALVGVMDGTTEALHILLKSGEGLKLIAAGTKDAAYGIVGKSAPIPIVAKPGHLAVETAPGAWEGYQKITSPDWINEFLPRVVFSGFTYRPIDDAHKIKKPVFIQIANNDLEASPDDQRRTAEKIGSLATQKSYECGHFDVFFGDFQAQCAQDGIDYLTGLLDAG